MGGITPEILEIRIREILNYGSVIYPAHVKKRMAERNYSFGDIRHILVKGKVRSFAKEGNEKYRCEVHGEDLEGDHGAVITIVVGNTKMIIVTVLGGI